MLDSPTAEPSYRPSTDCFQYWREGRGGHESREACQARCAREESDGHPDGQNFVAFDLWLGRLAVASYVPGHAGNSIAGRIHQVARLAADSGVMILTLTFPRCGDASPAAVK